LASALLGWRKSLDMAKRYQPFGARLSLVMPDKAPRPVPRIEWGPLMARGQAGDRETYRALLLDIEPYIRSIARRCFKHPVDIEDAVQDVLLTIHSIRHTYDPKRPFAPWLATIANRRVIDRLRVEARKKTREMELTPQHEAVPEETFSEIGSNHDGMAERGLLDAIGKLPTEQRIAVQLLKLNEMSLKEASQTSGRSIAALKVSVHRAINNLRKLMQRDQPT